MKLLFSAGTARGGTNFRTLMLNNHSKVVMAIDPFIPLFRLYRDSLLESVGHPCPRSAVLDDYYFSDEKLATFDAIQSADVDIPFDMADWPALKESLAARMSLASMNLVEHLDILPAPTFKQVFRNAVELVWRANGASDQVVLAGFNDNWTAEFFPLLAQLFPEAKFLLHLRDPRAVIHSSEYAEPDFNKRPPITSFARGLRKYMALGRMFGSNTKLKGRLLTTYYEPFVQDPEREIERVLDFLGLEFEGATLAIDRFQKADGSKWPTPEKIYSVSDAMWRDEMPRAMAEVTELICGHEMSLHGYQREVYEPRQGLSEEAWQYLMHNEATAVGWSTGFDELERTIGSEMFRDRMLLSGGTYPVSQIRRCFLFTEIFEELQNKTDV